MAGIVGGVPGQQAINDLAFDTSQMGLEHADVDRKKPEGHITKIPIHRLKPLVNI